MTKKQYDVIVLGGGPAGYVAAIHAAQQGLATALIEKEYLGGTCLNVGCIPTKALFQSAEVMETVKHAATFGIYAKDADVNYKEVKARKDKVVAQLVGGVKYLLKKNKVDVFEGHGTFVTPKKIQNQKTGEILEGKNIIIATGSSNFLPPISGVNGANVINSTQLLAMDTLPKSIAIIGGGVIGCEFANILASFGTQVSVIELLPHLLGNLEEACSTLTEQAFEQKGIKLLLGAKVTGIADGKNGEKEVICQRDGNNISVSAEYVLVATGRKSNSEGLGLEKLGVSMTRGFVQVNDAMETSLAGIYAAGDVTGKSFLAHAAYEEGVVAVDNIMGMKREMNFKAIPKAVFLDTEISSVGMSEEEAKKAGYQVMTGQFLLSGNGKALAMGKEKAGFVKVVAEEKNHLILGIHIAGPSASELVTIGGSLITMEAMLEDVEATIYPHPSVAEAIREACLDALGRAVHA